MSAIARISLHGLPVPTLVLAAAACGGPALAASPSPSIPAFRFADPAITESSGLAVSSYDDRAVFTHNDSGDRARFFAVDVRTGSTLAAYRVPDATNVDWEDMAGGTDETGRPALWFADIGDNRGRRPDVSVYRVREPQPAAGTYRSGSTTPPVRYRLRYPDGPHDAEALLVDVRRRALYVVTKSLSGAATVYAAPLRTGGPTELQLAATVELGLGAAVTGGAVSPSGHRLVLRTYADAYVWPLGPAGVPAALGRPPQRISLPAMPQGESVAFRADDTLLVGSEGRQGAVYAVGLPVPGPAATPSTVDERSVRTAPTGGEAATAAVLLTAAGAAAVLAGWAFARRRSGRALSESRRA